MFSDGELPPEVGSELCDRLLARRPEIERAMLARVRAVDDSATVCDPEYVAGLESTVSVMVGFAIEAVEGQTPPPIPVAVYSQARLAARNGVSFDTVAHRYLVGYLTLDEFIEQEAAADQAGWLRRRLRSLLDELTGEARDAFSREAGRRAQSGDLRRTKLLEELLTGESEDAEQAAPNFDFDLWHIGAIATGADASGSIAELADGADRRILRLRRAEDSVWVWFTGRRKLESTELQRLAAKNMPVHGCLALGEPHRGLQGWRLSHQQAAAALVVGLRRRDRIVRYGEVSTEASLLQDPVRANSLRQRYLVPLEDRPDGGETLRRTLAAYFTRDRNIKASATALGVARQTVSYRLRRVEALIDSELLTCAHELEAALALDRLDRGDNSPGP